MDAVDVTTVRSLDDVEQREHNLVELGAAIREYGALAGGGITVSIHRVPIGVFEDNPKLTDVTVHNQAGVYVAGKVRVAGFTITLFSVDLEKPKPVDSAIPGASF